MDHEAAAPMDYQAGRLERVREDYQLRFNTTVVLALG